MARPLQIACLQTRPMPSMAAALDEALPMAETAVRDGAEMLFLPEYCGGLRAEGAIYHPPAEPEATHPVLAAFRDLAAERGVWINVGSIAVPAPDGKVINRGYMIGPSGVLGHYDKIHLFDVTLSPEATYLESGSVAPGGAARVYRTPKAAVGHTICYDLRFPTLFRALAQAGAEILCCPAAFTARTGAAHWHILNRARAIENTCFVVSPCATGAVPGGSDCYGHSLVVSPWGDVLADGGPEPGVVHATLDLDAVAETAAKIPSLQHDRPFSPPDARESDVA
ncbi:MAG: carbon-nitrogen hydrolase family protein [Pseudomonadota bacterium]